MSVLFSSELRKRFADLKIEGRDVKVTYEQLASSEWFARGAHGEVGACKVSTDPVLVIAVKVRLSPTFYICSYPWNTLSRYEHYCLPSKDVNYLE
jgi:hypothetical protein